MIETLLYTVLTGNATVARKLNDRIYPSVLPQNVALPAVTYQRTSANPVNHLQGYSGMSNPHIMVNTFATRYEDAKTIARDILSVMDAARTFRAILSNEMDGFDPDVGVHVVSQDFSCWGAE